MTAIILKCIWVPIALLYSAMSMSILALVFADVGWDVAYRWIAILGFLAFAIDQWIYK